MNIYKFENIIVQLLDVKDASAFQVHAMKSQVILQGVGGTDVYQ